MTKIEWVKNADGSQGQSWNPIAGCSLASPGCTNCYAMKMAARLEAMGQKHYAGLTQPSKAGAVWTGKVALAPESMLLAPLKRKKPTTYFVNSMSDLFHKDVSNKWLDRIFASMMWCSQHTFQILTKRPKRALEYLAGVPERIRRLDCHAGLDQGPWPLQNVILGPSIEDQKRADERFEDTRAISRLGWKTMASCEPLLGPLDLSRYLEAFALNWVIVGGESGPGARDNNFLENARAIQHQCAEWSVPFFGKQGVGKTALPDDLNVREWPKQMDRAA